MARGLPCEGPNTGAWKYRRPSDKKEDRLAFGVWPAVSLADARAKRDEAKRLLVKRIAPKAEQKGAQAEAEGAYMFETLSRQWYSGSLKKWTPTHARALLRSLEHYVSNTLACRHTAA